MTHFFPRITKAMFSTLAGLACGDAASPASSVENVAQRGACASARPREINSKKE